MSKQRSRKKAAYVPPKSSKQEASSPRSYVITMLTLMGVGLAWTVTGYLTEMNWPIGAIRNWNLAIGFGLMISGFVMTMRWR